MPPGTNASSCRSREAPREDVWWTYGYSPIDDATAASGVGVLVVCRGVTAGVRAEREAVSEAERLPRLFEQAPGFMAMLRGRFGVLGGRRARLSFSVPPSWRW